MNLLVVPRRANQFHLKILSIKDVSDMGPLLHLQLIGLIFLYFTQANNNLHLQQVIFSTL